MSLTYNTNLEVLLISECQILPISEQQVLPISKKKKKKKKRGLNPAGTQRPEDVPLISPYNKPVSAVTSKRGKSSLSGKTPSSRFERIIPFFKTQNSNCHCACR